MPCAAVWQADRLPLPAVGAACAPGAELTAAGADVLVDCARAADATLSEPTAIMTLKRFIRDFIAQPPLRRQSRARTECALNDEAWNPSDGNPSPDQLPSSKSSCDRPNIAIASSR